MAILTLLIAAWQSDLSVTADPIQADFGRVGPITLGMSEQEFETTFDAADRRVFVEQAVSLDKSKMLVIRLLISLCFTVFLNWN